MSGPRQPGLHIAFVGIDGAGKSAYCARLQSDLLDRGLDCRILSWSTMSEVCASPVQKVTLDEALANCFRALFARSTGAEALLPASVSEDLLLPGAALLDAGIGPSLRAQQSGPSPSLVDQQGLVSAALFEMSSQTYAGLGLINPLLASGAVAISESFGLKYVIKLVCLLRALDPSSEGSVKALLAAAEAVFGTLLKPDIGVFVDTPETVAWARICARRKAIGLTEDMFLIGQTDDESGFLAMQRACQAEFRRYAVTHGWLQFTPTLMSLDEDYKYLRELLMPLVLEKIG